MIKKIIKALWGDLHGQELIKFVLLSCGSFFIIGSYWPIKILKDSIFINMVGPYYLPLAKMVSLAFFFPLVLAYSKFIDYVSREKAIYLLVTLFCCIGMLFAYFLGHPTIGVASQVVHPERFLGWFFYIFAESYVSLIVALYWSFINDITTPESAKKGYGMIIFGTQSGGLLFMILSNYLVTLVNYSKLVPLVVMISVATLCMVNVVVFILMKVVNTKELQGYRHTAAEASPKASLRIGFLDGLRMLFVNFYVAGIFGLVFFYELIATIMQYQMHLLVKSTYGDPSLVTKFLFQFGFAVQLIACLFGLLGTSYFQRTLGIRWCLVLYPLFLGIFISTYMVWPHHLVIAAVMIVAKAISYVFNQPAKEMLYIPTSKDIKYKSKAWIDMFGMRFGKGGGALVNHIIGPMVHLTGIFSLIIIAAWMVLANSIGSIFTIVTEKKESID